MLLYDDAVSLLPKLNALWRVPLILTVTACLATISVLFSLLDGSGRLQHGCARLWSRFILWVSRVRVTVKGLQHLDPGRGYVFTANHLSMFDHWAFLYCLPLQFRFAAKSSLFRIPFLGWHLKRSGSIPIDRHHPRQTVRALESLRGALRSGVSLVIYPEGGRSWGESVDSFKKGAFLVAMKSRAPIVPVTLIGAHRRLERGSIIIYPGEMEMIIHPCLEYREYKDLDLSELAEKVRGIILSSYRQVNR